MTINHPLGDPDLDDCPTVGRQPSFWRDLRVRLAVWLHPDSAFTLRFLPANPTAHDIALLIFLHGHRMKEEDLTEILEDIRRRLGIQPPRGLEVASPATAEHPIAVTPEMPSPPSPGGRFLIQNRYQDGGWEDVAGSCYHSRSRAFSEASHMSHNAIVYGMVRVVDTETGCIVVTFGAGSCGEPLE